MPTLDNVLAVAPNVVARESEDELVVVLPEAGDFFVLNGTGAEVFRLVDGERTLGEVAGALHARYGDVDLQRIQADVLAFAEKIIDKAAVRVQR